MPAQYAVGIDIGGTKIYAGVINVETGEVLSTARKRTKPDKGGDFFSGRLLEVTAQAIEGATEVPRGEIIAIGAGIAGQVDREHGILLNAPNLSRDLKDMPVSDLLRQRFDLPVTLGNDVEVATFGEMHFGAGKDSDDLACVFVGTGIGATLVSDRKIRRGASGTAGEFGHTVVQYGGRLCGCGGRGHLEAYASRTAITHVLLSEVRRGRDTLLRSEIKPGEPTIRSKLIARCVAEGDDLVIHTLNDAADYLGAGLGSLVNLYNPGRIILGGGLIEAVESFFTRAGWRAHEVALPVPGRSLDIVRTQLGDNSGIVGAAWMAANQHSPVAC